MPKRTGRPWRRIKAQVIRRDGGICHLCGQPGADSADHIIPAARITEAHWYDLGNLAAVHHNTPPQCNRKRGDRPIETTRARLRSRPNIDTAWKW